MNLLHRPFRKLVVAVCLFSAVAVALHFLLPFLVNTDVMRTRILSHVAERFPGEVDFQAIKPALFPLPHAEVIQARISEPDRFSVHVSKAIVYPQFWPLLAGHLKIGHLLILKPEIVIVQPPARPPAGEKHEEGTSPILGLQIRDSLAKAASGLGLPAVRIEGGRLALSRGGQSGIEFTHIIIDTKARGEQLVLRLTGRSNLVATFGFKGRIDMHTMNGSGQLDLTGLDPGRLTAIGLMPPSTQLPEMVVDMAMHLETQGLVTFQFGFQAKAPEVVVKNGSRRLTIREPALKGTASWTARQARIAVEQFQSTSPEITLNGQASWSFAGRPSAIPDEAILRGLKLDVMEVRRDVLQLAGDNQVVRDIFDIVQGGRMPELVIALKKSGEAQEKITKRIGLEGRLTGGRIVVLNDLMNLEEVSGKVVLDKGRLTAQHLSARLGSSKAQNGALELGLLDGTRAFTLDTEVDADLSEIPATLRRLISAKTDSGLLDQIPPIVGNAKGRLRLGDSLDRITARVTADGHINALDADLDFSGTVGGLPSAETTIQISLSGPMGPRTVEWLGRRGAVPDEFLPKAPLTVTGLKVTRNAVGEFVVSGEFSLADGLQLTAALRVGQDGLDVNKLHLKDAASDAELTFRQGRNVSNWTAGFKGYLDKSTVDKILRQNTMVQGWLRGDLKADFQTDALEGTSVQGRLAARQITVPLGTRPPLDILEASLEGQGNRLVLSSAELKWQQSTGRLSGSGSLTPQALDLDLVLSADIMDADKIIQDLKEEKHVPEAQPSKSNDLPAVRGKVRVKAGQLILGGYHFAPLQAVVTLQAEKTTVDVQSAYLCGIAVPGQIRVAQGGLQMEFKPHAAGSTLQDVDQCLAGSKNTERLEGTVSASGNIATHGRTGQDLTRNLAGGLDFQISDGRIYNIGAAGFFTNLLSFISVNQLIEGGLPDLRENDFKYKSLAAKLSLKDGRLHIEEGVLKSNAVNIVGSGDYGVASKKLDLVLLVSPLTTVDWIVERIPLVGHILQGTLVAIPVGVKGPAVDPAVVPLSPAAVGSRLGGILERTIKTPFRILSPLWKNDSPSH